MTNVTISAPQPSTSSPATTMARAEPAGHHHSGAPVLDVVVPVYNEERDLSPCVRKLYEYLSMSFPYPFRITIADNASTDTTLSVAHRLAEQLPHVAVRHLDEKGRGRALRAAWLTSDASVLAYLDVDLSTDLSALLPLVAPLISGHSDLAIGSRLARGSRVVRGPKREFISRCYNVLLRGSLAARFSDAQCGFKAIRSDVAAKLLPLVEDTGWFFDTEMLVLAERAGLRIHEVPVDWVDDPDSRVDIVATALADLRGIGRVGKGLLTGAIPVAELRRQLGREPLATPTPGWTAAPTPGRIAAPTAGRIATSTAGWTAAPTAGGIATSTAGWTAPTAGGIATSAVGGAAAAPPGLIRQLARFGVVGIASTVAYLVLYVALRALVGAQAANLIALLTTAIANTAANRRLTFGVRGAAGAARHQFQGLLIFFLGLGLTSGSLAALTAIAPHPHRLVELTVLVVANLAATLLRFLLLRSWVFASSRRS